MHQNKIVEEINFARQKEQQEVYGKQLRVMESQYEELIQKHFQLKQAVASLEAEVCK